MSDFLTSDELREMDDLLDRCESLTQTESARLKALADKNKESLQPDIGRLFEVLADLTDEELESLE